MEETPVPDAYSVLPFDCVCDAPVWHNVFDQATPTSIPDLRRRRRKHVSAKRTSPIHIRNLRAAGHQVPQARSIIAEGATPLTKVTETAIDRIARGAGLVPACGSRRRGRAILGHDGDIDQTELDVERALIDSRGRVPILNNLRACIVCALVVLCVRAIRSYAKQEWG